MTRSMADVPTSGGGAAGEWRTLNAARRLGYRLLGRMTAAFAIGQMAGLGLRITSVVQDRGQLKSLYHDRFET